MGVQQRKSREREQRRRRFIDVSRSLFLEHGYDGTSIDQIAQAAEFSKRTVYLYFEDKREVFLAVVLDSLAQLHKRLRSAVEGHDLGLTGVLALAKAYCAFAQDRADDFRLTLEFEAREYYYQRDAASLGEFARRCVEVNDRNTQLVLDGLERGQLDGSVRDDVRPIELLLLFWGASVGVIQVVAMRSEQLAEGQYETSPEALYKLLLESLERTLSHV